MFFMFLPLFFNFFNNMLSSSIATKDIVFLDHKKNRLASPQVLTFVNPI